MATLLADKPPSTTLRLLLSLHLHPFKEDLKAALTLALPLLPGGHLAKEPEARLLLGEAQDQHEYKEEQHIRQGDQPLPVWEGQGDA